MMAEVCARSLGSEIGLHCVFEHVHQLRIHVAKVVGNIQRVNPLVFKQTGVLGLQAIQVFAFHDKDDIGPANIRWADGSACVRACARRAGIEAGAAVPDRFRRGTTPLVTTADEQEVCHS